MKKKFIFKYLVLVMLITSSITSCGSDTEKTDKIVLTDTDDTIITKSSSVPPTPTDEPTEESTDENKNIEGLPEDYPIEIVPIIDGAIVKKATNENYYSVELISDKDVAECYKFYLDVFADEPSMVKTENTSIGSMKGKYYCGVSFASTDSSEGKTGILIMIKNIDMF